ncbi:MAG: hypothetical protein QM728_06045 [Gordonia sp. (in: high G+C Gram-positive bacteria)]|uniref:hypothetical protein n=1 Tax=Gordonia sp. (in: high G+C Gram-positive bacteria) TaxID=84139 RepID=UPI0039E214C2
MSRTVPVFRGESLFWALDAALAVWLFGFLDGAQERRLEDDPWWAERLHSWQVTAIVGGTSVFDLPEEWVDDRLETFTTLALDSVASLREQDELDTALLAKRLVFGDATTSASRYHQRKQETVATEPIALLGEALVDLAHGTLPPPPKGHRVVLRDRRRT